MTGVISRDCSGIAVLCGDFILLNKRIELYKGQPVPFGGYWSIFGGAIDTGESPLLSAQRELLEESGIKCSIKNIFYADTLNQKTGKFHIHYCFQKELVIPTLNFEHTESGWFNIFNLGSFPDKIDHNIIDIIVKHAYQ
jgi:8-oxo-dGTP pyrophosphatase MutT (NUDIX family)